MAPVDEVDRYGHHLGEQGSMGLLEYLSSHTLDEDYAFVSQRRDQRRGRPAGQRRIGLVGAVVMAAFAVLAVTAAQQTSRNAVADDQQRSELVSQVRTVRKQVEHQQAQVRSLQEQTLRLRTRVLAGGRTSSRTLAQLRSLGLRAGTVAARGQGVRVTADDAPGADSPRQMVLDTDLQRLVNGLWEAGAEAIALNGQRLTNQSTIRLAGTAITVNNRSLRRPYAFSVIGDKDTLPARFANTSSGQAWLDLTREVGLRLRITPVNALRLPAAELPTLRYTNQKAGEPS